MPLGLTVPSRETNVRKPILDRVWWPLMDLGFPPDQKPQIIKVAMYGLLHKVWKNGAREIGQLTKRGFYGFTLNRTQLLENGEINYQLWTLPNIHAKGKH